MTPLSKNSRKTLKKQFKTLKKHKKIEKHKKKLLDSAKLHMTDRFCYMNVR
jgi:hypothetical protein